MIEFYKYQGTGNDFILIDNRQVIFDGDNIKLIAQLCDRRFGIGADGLMLLENHSELDFTMRYFNSDGKEASMCGNGGRCIAAFAVHLGIIKDESHFSFMAVDGVHDASFKDDIVSLKMINVQTTKQLNNGYFMNTGSPHYVEFNTDIDAIDLVKQGRDVRYSSDFKPDGTNVNYVQFLSDTHIKVRTYERGVEDETLACGTGVVASSIAAFLERKENTEFKISVKGGSLKVHFEVNDQQHFENVWLIGPAKMVFKGRI